MKNNPIVHGIQAGVVIPFVLLAPTLIWGPLADVLRADRTFFLMPALAMLLVPGGFAGMIAARLYRERREAWRFATGLLIGGSFVGSLLFAFGTGNFVTVLFGGVLLVGFWLWLGALLGLATGYAQREDAAPSSNP